MTNLITPLRLQTAHSGSVLLGLLLWQAAAAHAQGLGVASLGATDGLTIPSAYVLGSGDLALSMGSYQDPKLGTFNRKQNYSMGIGLLPRVELFGRFAEYSSRFSASPGAANLNRCQGAADRYRRPDGPYRYRLHSDLENAAADPERGQCWLPVHGVHGQPDRLGY
ncbi:hypothetical protein LP416_30450 [Polaromonas sp. P2-4]|nr:hypothetical protein LP416_30450 [Polaromonas sp. P2-4]